MINQSAGKALPLVISGSNADTVGKELMSTRGYVKLGEPNKKTVFGGNYGAMTGSYVAPEIYAAMTSPQQMTQGFLNEALALALQAKGAAQAAKTIYSPLTQVPVGLVLDNGKREHDARHALRRLAQADSRKGR